MRRVFQAALDKAFRPGDHVFEIGCGTGIDALRLARAGVEVVATDISEAMIAEVVVKARAEGISERVRCRALAAKDIGLLRTEFGESSFDGGYSHAGALNMEPQILLPPSNLTDLFALFRPLFTPFEHLEDRISTVWPMSEWGHHTILTFQRL